MNYEFYTCNILKAPFHYFLSCTGKDHSTREVTPTGHTTSGRSGEE